jgi:hypothetical protein
MALISKTIANLLNGVSQQPPSIRNPTQCEVQENYLSDVTQGNCHRPHTTFLETLASLGASPARPHFHDIDKGPGSRYKVMITDGDLKVFDMETGEEKTVNFPDGKAYLAADNPYQNFQCLTIGERTFVLNKTVSVGTVFGSYDLPEFERGSLVFIKQGDYSTDYKITVATSHEEDDDTPLHGPSEITKTTSATDPDDIKTSEIAADLEAGLDALAMPGLEVVRSGSVLWLYPSQPTVGDDWWLKVSIADSKGNNNMRLVRNQIQKFSDLPSIAPNNFKVQVVGDKASGFDDYYVQFSTDDTSASFGNGSWSECPANPPRKPHG